MKESDSFSRLVQNQVQGTILMLSGPTFGTLRPKRGTNGATVTVPSPGSEKHWPYFGIGEASSMLTL